MIILFDLTISPLNINFLTPYMILNIVKLNIVKLCGIRYLFIAILYTCSEVRKLRVL